MIAAFAAVQLQPGQLAARSGGGDSDRPHFGKGPGLAAQTRVEETFRIIHADGLVERLPTIRNTGGGLPGPGRLHGGQFGAFADGVSDRSLKL